MTLGDLPHYIKSNLKLYKACPIIVLNKKIIWQSIFNIVYTDDYHLLKVNKPIEFILWEIY